MPEIVTDNQEIERLVTGMYSFDRSFESKAGEIGYPYGVSTEVFGPTGCGKSTFVYSLSGMLAASSESDIALADLEGFNPKFLNDVLEQNGMVKGKVHVLRQKKHEEVLEALLDEMWNNANVGILDSIGAVVSVAELEGDIGDANWGKRAIIMNQFSRKATILMNFNPNKNLFMINHVQKSMEGFGFITPGGTGKDFLNSIHIQIKRKEEFDDGSYVLEGKVKKNRWGYKDRLFYVVILAGGGIHKGLTAMFDGTLLGIVDRKKTIKIGDKSIGYLKTILEKASEGDQEFFAPFHDAIKDYSSRRKSNGKSEDTELPD